MGRVLTTVVCTLGAAAFLTAGFIGGINVVPALVGAALFAAIAVAQWRWK